MGLEEELQISDYTILEEAGRGNFGIVYKAREISSDKERAIKVLERIEGGRGEAAYTLFRSEGLEQNETLADVFYHENLVRFYRQGVVQDGSFAGQKYIVLEWVEGTTLEYSTSLTPRAIDAVIKQICRGVQHMHERGYLHNDIRTPNVMVTASFAKKDSPFAKLGDYTLVTPCDKQGKAVTSANISSRTISAPESIRNGELSARTDIWGLGILMYQLWTGEHPFPHSNKDVLEEMVRTPASYVGLETRIQRSTHIPGKYKHIIKKCLSYNPAYRYQSVEALLHDLEPPKTRLSLGFVLSGTVLAALGCLGIGTGALFYSQKPDPVIQTETVVEHVPVTYSQYRKVQRDPRIPSSETPKSVCDTYQKKVIEPSSFKYEYCIEFKEAEQLLDQANFIAAARKLETLQKQYPKRYEPAAALLEAYYELGLFIEAEEQRRIVIEKFGEYNPKELAYYADVIQRAILDAPTTFSLTQAVCTLESIQVKYLECYKIAALPGAEEEQYKAIVRGYPKSFLAHREYARFLFEKDRVEESLAHYKSAARITGNKYPFFQEIADAFERHQDYPHAFVYQYQAERSLVVDFSRIGVSHGKSDVLFRTLHRLDANTFTSKEEAYRLLVEKCTGNADFGFVPCTF